MQKLGGFPVNSKLTVFTINVFFAGLPRWIPLRFDDGAKIRTTHGGWLPYKCLLHAVYILLRWDFVLLRLAQAILSCMPRAPPLGFCHACRRRHLAAVAHAADVKQGLPAGRREKHAASQSRRGSAVAAGGSLWKSSSANGPAAARGRLSSDEPSAKMRSDARYSHTWPDERLATQIMH